MLEQTLAIFLAFFMLFVAYPIGAALFQGVRENANRELLDMYRIDAGMMLLTEKEIEYQESVRMHYREIEDKRREIELRHLTRGSR